MQLDLIRLLLPIDLTGNGLEALQPLIIVVDKSSSNIDMIVIIMIVLLFVLNTMIAAIVRIW